MAKGQHNRVATAIVAPRKYLSGSERSQLFDRRISYEDLSQAVSSDADRELLARAISKASISYSPDEARTEYKQNYFRIAQEVWPSAKSNPPTTQPKGCKFSYALQITRHPEISKCCIEHMAFDDSTTRQESAAGKLRIMLQFADLPTKEKWLNGLTRIAGAHMRPHSPSEKRLHVDIVVITNEDREA